MKVICSALRVRFERSTATTLGIISLLFQQKLHPFHINPIIQFDRYCARARFTVVPPSQTGSLATGFSRTPHLVTLNSTAWALSLL